MQLNQKYPIMKHILIYLILCLPFFVYAETDDVDLEEEITTQPPIRKSYAPRPKLMIEDREVIKIETQFEVLETRITVTDMYSKMVFEGQGILTFNLPQPLNIGEVYTIILYLNGRKYAGHYIP